MSTLPIVPCPPPNPGDPCSDLLSKIWELVFRNKREFGNGGTHGLFHRFPEQINGRSGPGTDGWRTHDETIRNQQRGLGKRNNQYRDQGCGDPPAWAIEWAAKPAPTPAEWKDPAQTTNALKAAGATVGIGVAAYVAYRVIRMIPSLFPPLWPTIPVNAAVP